MSLAFSRSLFLNEPFLVGGKYPSDASIQSRPEAAMHAAFFACLLLGAYCSKREARNTRDASWSISIALLWKRTS
jgi:hypothetical protein